MANLSWPMGRRLAACGAVVSLALLSGCAGDNDESESDSAGGGAQSETSDTSSQRAGSDDSAAIAAGLESVAVESSRELIKTGTVALESADVDRLLDRLDGVVTSYQGLVESEDVRTDDDGDARAADVVVRVPVDRFESAVDEITDLGTLVREQSSSEDVTTRVADINARVASAQRSIDSLRRLFDRADKLSDVIALESQLARRQANLESLQARRSGLARQTAMSTIRLSIERLDAEPRDEDSAGFVDGIRSGWSGLVTFVRGTVHVVGLVLPLGALTAIVAMPVWLALRRWRPADRA